MSSPSLREGTGWATPGQLSRTTGGGTDTTGAEVAQIVMLPVQVMVGGVLSKIIMSNEHVLTFE